MSGQPPSLGDGPEHRPLPEPSSATYPPDPYAGYRPPPPEPPARWTLERGIRLLLGAGLVAVAAWLLWYFGSLVVYLLVGMLLAYLMRPLVDRFQGLGFGRIPSILLTFVLVFGGLGVLLTQLVPFAGRQLTELSNQVSFQTAAQVSVVEPGSPGEAAGLRQGDLIVAVEGAPWKGYLSLQALLRGKQAGDTLRVTVDDADDRRIVRAVRLGPRDLDKLEVLNAEATAEEEVRRLGALGVSVREVAFSEVASSIERRVRRLLPVEKGAVVRGVTSALSSLFAEERITQLASSIVGIFTDIFYAVLVVPFVTFFFLKDGLTIRHSLLRLVPNRYFEITLAIIEKIEANIGRYFRALFLQSISVATVATVLLYVVGLEYALAVGVFTGLANTIPYFGPLMGFLAGALVGIVQTGDFSLLPGVLVAMLLTQVSDNAIFQPFIFSRAAQTHPLVILFVVLVGAQLAGIVGMLVAIPVVTILRVTVQQVLWSLRNYRILRSA